MITVKAFDVQASSGTGVTLAQGEKGGLPIIAVKRPGDQSAKVKLPDWARPALPKPHSGKPIMEC